jgi:hypothetical protein
MGKSLASPSPSPYLAPSLPSVVRPTTPSRRSSYLSDLDVLQDDADDHPDGRLRAVSRTVRGWSDLVVAKVEENAGLCLIALSQGLVCPLACYRARPKANPRDIMVLTATPR